MLVSYVHDQLDGYVKNLAGGTVINYGPATGGRFGSVAAANEFGSEDTDAFYLAARYKGDNLIVDYRFDYTDNTSVQQGTQALGFLARSRRRFCQADFFVPAAAGWRKHRLTLTPWRDFGAFPGANDGPYLGQQHHRLV